MHNHSTVFSKPALYIVFVTFLALTNLVLAQTSNNSSTTAHSNETASAKEKFTVQDSRNPKVFLKHLAEDQKSIWTSPFRLKPDDAAWLVPVGGVTAGLIETDATVQKSIPGNHISLSNNIANFGVGAYGGVVIGAYLLGMHQHDPREEETGLLAGEAGLNAFAISYVFKYAFQRQRPLEGNGRGDFWTQPNSGSFYSAHSTVAFAFASVIASEYPGWLSSSLAYGGATVIAAARLTGKQHFPSDVFVGALTGYLIGKDVYKLHHNPDLDGTQYGTFVKDHTTWSSETAGSTFVPLGEWEYPLIDRLMASGLILTQINALRPYTRTAMADMVSEAEYRISDNPNVSPTLLGDVSALKQEFAYELGLESSQTNQSLSLPSELYTQATYISGMPLNDSYHFGETITNNFGRPYQGGFNNVTGFRSSATNGRFSFFVTGEYEHAPGAPAYPLSAREAIASADAIPLPPDVPTPTTNQFRLLDAYAAITLAGHNISVGKQSLWWDPTQGSAMIISDNALPFYMLNIDRIIPLKLPWILKYLGPVRYDFFFGQLADHQTPPAPFIHGEKFSFKPTENLEFGFSRTAVFAGEGLTPLTFRTFWNSFISTTSSTNPGFNLRNSAGVRHSEFDFTYRIPKLRNWLSIYADSLVHDDLSPIDAPRRAAITPGFYLTHFPGIAKLDLHVEAGYTDIPVQNSNGGKFLYWETFYRDVYINGKQLMGSWMGREGKGVQAWSTYWFSPRTTLQVSYREAKVAKDFITYGVTINDFGARAQYTLHDNLQVTALLQYEQWKAPVLATGLQQDVVTSIGVNFWPKVLALKGR
jgi:membrane-associated phospholipid phosphatase